MTEENKVKDFRIKSKMTQKDLAKKLGVNHQTIARWEKNQTQPSTSMVRELAMIFDTTINAILGYESATYSLNHRIIGSLKDKNSNKKNYYYGRLFIDLHGKGGRKVYFISEEDNRSIYDFFHDNPPLIDGKVSNRNFHIETMCGRYLIINPNNIKMISTENEESVENIASFNDKNTVSKNQTPQISFGNYHPEIFNGLLEYSLFLDDRFSKNYKNKIEKVVKYEKEVIAFNDKNLNQEEVDQIFDDRLYKFNSKVNVFDKNGDCISINQDPRDVYHNIYQDDMSEAFLNNFFHFEEEEGYNNYFIPKNHFALIDYARGMVNYSYELEIEE